MSAPLAIAAQPSPSFWQRRIGAPLRAQLTQGISPDRLALTASVGTACSLLPLFGFTTALNLVVGFWLRLNQPLLQVLNQLLGPPQLALILVYVRIGEKLWGAPPLTLSIPVLAQVFKDDPAAFMRRFGWTGIHALSAWLLSVPLIVGGLYYALRPVMHRFAAPRRAR